MTSESERLTVRLPNQTVQMLQELVRSGEYATVSDAVRAAIERFMEIRFAPDYVRRLTIEFPKGNVIDLQQLVKEGDSVSIEDAVRNAVREYIRRRLSRALEGAKEE